MKKIVLLLFVALQLAFTGCQSEENFGKPLPVTNVSYTSQPGAIELTWDWPEDFRTNSGSDAISYLKISYYDKIAKSNVEVLAPSINKSCVIGNTLKKHGAYELNVSTVSVEGVESTPVVVEAISGAAATYLTEYSEVELSAEGMSSNAQESTEGSFDALVDRNPSTYFHSIYSEVIEEDHNITIDAGLELKYFKFSFNPRNYYNVPKTFTLLGSVNGTDFTKIADVDTGYQPNAYVTSSTKWDSGEIVAETPFRYLRLVVTSTFGYYQNPVTDFFAISELYLYAAELIDPEA